MTKTFQRYAAMALQAARRAASSFSFWQLSHARTIALTAALTVAGAADVKAASCTGLECVQKNRVWAGCSLRPQDVQAVKDAMSTSDANHQLGGKEVAFIVVYTRNPNDGQALAGTPPPGYTAPVVCLNPGPDVNTGVSLGIQTTTEEKDIPNATDQPGATSVDLLDIEEALLTRYKVNKASPTIEKRFCHSVANTGTGNAGDPNSPPPETNVDCVRIYPK
jgi:hypothetical protein